MGQFILDFAVPARKLGIELDGGQHALRVDADARRTAYLGQKGWRVIRFWSNEVLGNQEGVMAEILRQLELEPP